MQIYTINMDFLIPVFFITCVRKVSDTLAQPLLNYMTKKTIDGNLVPSSRDFVMYSTSNFQAARSVLSGIILDWRSPAQLGQFIPKTLRVLDAKNTTSIELYKLSMDKPVILNMGSAS